MLVEQETGLTPDTEPIKPSGRSKFLVKLAIGAMVFATLGVALMLYWSFQSNDVMNVNKIPIPTRTIRDHPTAGGVVILTIDYCKKQNATGTARTSFVSSSREVFLPIHQERTPVGCGEIEYPVLIPKDIVPDVYTIKIRTVHDINPLKRGIVREFQSMPVHIDPTTPTNERK